MKRVDCVAPIGDTYLRELIALDWNGRVDEGLVLLLWQVSLEQVEVCESR